MGMLGCDQVEEDFQALFRRERTAMLAVRLLRLGKGMKYAEYLFHRSNISCRRRAARNYFGCLA